MTETVKVPGWIMYLICMFLATFVLMVVSGGLVPRSELHKRDAEIERLSKEFMEKERAYRDTLVRYAAKHPCDDGEIIIIEKNK